MHMNFKNYKITNEDLHPKKLKILKQLGLPLPIRVPIRMRGLSSKGTYKRCHNNVIKMVQKYGGKRLVGHEVIPYKRGLEVLDHSVWITPENKIVCITKENYSKNIIKRGYLVFLPREVDEAPEILVKNSYYDFIVQGNSVEFLNNNGTYKTVKLRSAKKYIKDTYQMDLKMGMKLSNFLECA